MARDLRGGVCLRRPDCVPKVRDEVGAEPAVATLLARTRVMLARIARCLGRDVDVGDFPQRVLVA